MFVTMNVAFETMRRSLRLLASGNSTPLPPLLQGASTNNNMKDDNCPPDNTQLRLRSRVVQKDVASEKDSSEATGVSPPERKVAAAAAAAAAAAPLDSGSAAGASECLESAAFVNVLDKTVTVKLERLEQTWLDLDADKGNFGDSDETDLYREASAARSSPDGSVVKCGGSEASARLDDDAVADDADESKFPGPPLLDPLDPLQDVLPTGNGEDAAPEAAEASASTAAQKISLDACSSVILADVVEFRDAPARRNGLGGGRRKADSILSILRKGSITRKTRIVMPMKLTDLMRLARRRVHPLHRWSRIITEDNVRKLSMFERRIFADILAKLMRVTIYRKVCER